MKSRSVRAAGAVLAVTALVTAACGTRSADSGQQAAPAQEEAAPTGDPQPSGPGAVQTAPAGDVAASTGAPAAPTAATQGPSSASVKAPAGSATAAKPVAPGGAGRTAQTQPGQAEPAGSRPTPGTPVAGQPAAAQPPVAPGSSPVIVGSVGTYSGVVGGMVLPMTQAAQAWVSMINTKGGLNGHPVKLIVFDDGGEPARHQALVQEAVERRHVLAFLQNGEVVTGHASVDYITKKRIPIIGVTGGEIWTDESPMYFLQGPTGRTQFATYPFSLAQLAIPEGKTILGSLVCVEIPGCAIGQDVIGEHAADLGFKYAYAAKISLAQPDFTAECLNAKNAGVQVFFVLADANTLGRVAASCARQSFRPLYSMTAQAMMNFQFTDDANLENMVIPFTVFPWFQRGTAATDEYGRAMAAYGKGVVSPYVAPWGWVSGKILEKAGAQMSEPPTTDALLAGLWSIKNETFGGITAPVTFNQEQPAKPPVCWFNVRIKSSAWVTPDNFKQHCK